jgi:thiamine biosynthesis lipoprotein
MQQCMFRAMGCRIKAFVDSDTPGTNSALEQVPGWFANWERCLSRFRDDSELTRLNRSGNRTVRVSQVLWDVLDVALAAAQQTEGLVTPTLLDALEAAGYNSDFETVLQRSTTSSDEDLLRRASTSSQATNAGWRAIQRDAEHRCVRLLGGVRLDFGGVAKGWAANRAVQHLSSYGPARVDAGGDIAVSGPLASGARWPIGVADPLAPDADIELLLLAGGGVATSGRDYRRWQRDGAWQHHIIDPRSGRPAETDLLSATVIAPNVVDAEIAAKVALILGGRDGLAWIEARQELAGLLVLENGRVLRSQRLQNYVEC